MTSSQYKQRSLYATDAQINFVRKLRNERSFDAGPKLQLLFVSLDAGHEHPLIPAADIRAAIDSLLACPKLQQAAPKPHVDIDPGYYVRGEEVFVVVWNKTKTHTYAKQLRFVPTATGHRPEWQYSPGANISLEGLSPLTVEQAARLGHLHGYCIICSRALTDPESVQRGIGPVCIKRLHGHA
jgi:Family of unknown function (DUF6011)